MNPDQIYCDGRTYAEHVAWLNNLSKDDTLIVMTPSGRLCDLVLCTYYKRQLAAEGSVLRERMDWLECLGILRRDNYVSADAMIALEPACDTAMAMIAEALKLHCSRWTYLLGDFRVFQEFARLNPSLMAALRLCNPHTELAPSATENANHACI